MTAADVLDRLAELGINAWTAGEKLRLEPGSKVPPELFEEVRQHKAEILSVLRTVVDGQALLLNRPPATEQELRRLIDLLADPEAFARWREWAMTFTDQADGMPQYGGSKSVKRASATSDTGIVGHLPEKNEIPDSTVLLTRLRDGQSWLLDQHSRWQSGDTTAADDAEFSRVWNGWWKLDHRLRADYGFQGCIYDSHGVCPDGFPCQGCANLPIPSVVAQLELT